MSDEKARPVHKLLEAVHARYHKAESKERYTEIVKNNRKIVSLEDIHGMIVSDYVTGAMDTAVACLSDEESRPHTVTDFTRMRDVLISVFLVTSIRRMMEFSEFRLIEFKVRKAHTRSNEVDPYKFTVQIARHKTAEKGQAMVVMTPLQEQALTAYIKFYRPLVATCAEPAILVVETLTSLREESQCLTEPVETLKTREVTEDTVDDPATVSGKVSAEAIPLEAVANEEAAKPADSATDIDSDSVSIASMATKLSVESIVGVSAVSMDVSSDATSRGTGGLDTADRFKKPSVLSGRFMHDVWLALHGWSLKSPVMPSHELPVSLRPPLVKSRRGEGYARLGIHPQDSRSAFGRESVYHTVWVNGPMCRVVRYRGAGFSLVATLATISDRVVSSGPSVERA
ncbi:hypothetical protein GWK47_028716 [Chionoecetes opilio]|uniref:Uncharacterized protein n=1 Tax=Chionoecetes opilio TaxID=41210 RepID=A0A8J4YKX8_CHIOP|nr:hypothetical protein GWK47_028716 [Chionoecetes opilio]